MEISTRIDWSDLDLFGHLNNVTFFKYIKQLVCNYAIHAHRK